MRAREQIRNLETQLRVVREEEERLRALVVARDTSIEQIRANRRLTVIESPFLGGLPWAVAYARAALADSLGRGESPFASHLLYPQVLDDMDASSRKKGLEAGLALYPQAVSCVVYVDFGITPGMAEGIVRAAGATTPVYYRAFGPAIRQQIAEGNGFVPKDVVAGSFAWPLKMIPR